jgi:predicted deacylase
VARNQAITVGGISVAPGQTRTIDLPVADLYTATSLSMPVVVVCGRSAGPTMFVSAAVHGDEINGVEIIRRLLKRKALQSLRGTLLAVPVVNVHGFLDQSRYLPDRRDLNRSFPGSPRGSVAARLAHLFTSEIVARSDFGIDIHTGSSHRFNLPQIRGSFSDPGTLELAQTFGAPVVIEAGLRDGSLRASAAQRGLPVLVYEAGEALRFNEIAIRAGLRGIVSVMRYRGMLPKASAPIRVTPLLARSTRWVRAPVSGIITGKAALGSAVKKGQCLAIVTDPIGDQEQEIPAPFSGIVISITNLPLAHEGDALFHIASFESIPEAREAVEEFNAAHEADPSTAGSST